MSVPNVAILWPIKFEATSYVLRVTVGGVTSNLNFPASGSLTVGREYWISGDEHTDSLDDDSATGAGDLLKMLQTTLDSHADASTFTVSIDTNGFVSVVSSSASFSILWTHASSTLDESIFGFESLDTTSATSCTSTRKPQGRWYPGRAITDDGRNRQPIVGGISRSLSNRTRVSRIALPSQERDLSIRQFAKEVALTEYVSETDPTGSFEYAWINALSLGYPFRLYEDDSAIALASYNLYRMRDLSDPLGRHERFRIWWDISLRATLLMESAPEYSLDLDGSTGGNYDYAQAADSSSLDLSTAFTWSIWFKPRDMTGIVTLFEKAGTSNDNGYKLQFLSSGTEVRVSCANTGSATTHAGFAITAPALNTWHHIAVTWAGSTSSRLWLDGVEQTVGANTIATLRNSAGALKIGIDKNTSNPLNGRVCEVALFNVDKGATYAAALYAQNGSDISADSGLAAYWRFADDALDSSGNGNTVTLNGQAHYVADHP